MNTLEFFAQYSLLKSRGFTGQVISPDSCSKYPDEHIEIYCDEFLIGHVFTPVVAVWWAVIQEGLSFADTPTKKMAVSQTDLSAKALRFNSKHAWEIDMLASGSGDVFVFDTNPPKITVPLFKEMGLSSPVELLEILKAPWEPSKVLVV
ncbi:hypothetical protein COB55_03745 [Candidatus Wolfebacteria bacterium]|nr:MAG: hypothetical protein COB55_03745 [Candidatus Wolfebacteria bacterium]